MENGLQQRMSVVIPTFNGAQTIAALFDALQSQKPRAPDEIIAVDSGSTDGTREKVLAAGGRMVDWTQPFDHGLARDAGIGAATGEIVFLTVQDAVPREDWMASMLRHFADPLVAGVSTRQIPPPDGPLELKIKAELDDAGVRTVNLKDHPDYAAYSPSQRLALYRFDNVASAIRRSIWERHPFGSCRYAEDLQWARKVLEAGHSILFDPSSPVVHAHRRGFGYEFRRALLDAWVMDEAFGYRHNFFEKADRIGKLASDGANFSQRAGALRTYAAHGLARVAYRAVIRPIGGRGLLERMTQGI